MGFSNSTVGGVGNLIRSWIQSVPFVSGSTGWRISKNGNAEFNGATFRGIVVVQGNQAILFYSGIPALGNLVGSIAPTGGTDTFGNVYPTGYFFTDGTVKFILDTFTIFTHDAIQLKLSTGYAHEGVSGQFYSLVSPGGGATSMETMIAGPQNTAVGGSDGAGIGLYSGSDDGVSNNAQGFLYYFTPGTGPGPSGTGMLVWDFTGMHGTGFITSPQPGGTISRSSPALPESWHNFALTANFVNYGAPFVTARYQQEGIGAGRVRFEGAVKLNGNQAANTVIANLSSAYTPLNSKYFVTPNNLGSGSIETVKVGSDGTVRIGVAGLNGQYVILDGICYANND